MASWIEHLYLHIMFDFSSNWYEIITSYQLLLTLSLLSAFYWICIRKLTVVKKEDYQMRPPVRVDEPYVGEESKSHLIDIPPISGWLATKVLRLMTNTLLKSYLDRKTMTKMRHTYPRSIVYPERPTFFPLVKGDSHLYERKPIQEKDLWHLIKERTYNTDGRFQFVSISDLILLYKEGKKTPETVMKTLTSFIKKSEAQTPPLRGFTEYYEDKIMEQAVASTKRWKAGEPISVVDGIPIGVKDEFFVGNHHCRNGLPIDMFDKEHDISEEKGLVKKLRQGGAILVGMSNMHQLGIGITGINPAEQYGTARNPYNVRFPAGGSSSGSATVVASGLSTVSLGTDGGGSIRIPAACCGIVGLKGTYGLYSHAGMACNSYTVGHPGALCSTVRDTAIMFGFLAGKDDDFPLGLIQPPVFMGEFDNLDVSGLKIGVDWVWMNESLPEIKAACENALKWLKEIYRVEVVSIHVPEKVELRWMHLTAILSEMRNTNCILADVYSEELNIDALSLLELAKNFDAHDYLQSAKQRTRSINALKYIFTQVDIIFTPASFMLLPKVTPSMEKYGFSDIAVAIKVVGALPLANLTGVPAITLPVAYSDANLPIAVQLISSWWREDNLLKMAYALERCVKRKAPQLYFDIRE